MNSPIAQPRTWAAAALIFCALALPGDGQFGNTPPAPADGMPPVLMVVPPNRETLQALRHAREALKQNRTADAFQLLQRLIELPEDYFTDKSMSQTLKSETLRILAELSPAERQAYELLQGAAARDLVDEARTTGNSQRLEEVVRRFPLTQASFQAAEMLALQSFDRGEVARAAAQFALLRAAPLASADQARQWAVREALARQLAGQPQQAAELLKEVSASGSVREKVAGEPLPIFKDAEQASRWLAQVAGPQRRSEAADPGNWLAARGSPTGTTPRPLNGPIGGPQWHVPHLAALEAELSPSSPGLLLQRLKDAETPLKDAEQLTWPTTVPLIIGDAIVFRTPRDVVALDGKTGAVRWRSILRDADFDQQWTADAKAANGSNDALELSRYLQERLFEDSAFGNLSSNGELVFALQGLPLEPSPMVNNFNGIRVFNPDEAAAVRKFNRLAAYELRGGRLAWEVGGERNDAAAEFAGHYFLGTPLSCDGNLFVLVECQGEIRLLAVEATPAGLRKLWSQPLVAPLLKVTDTDDRRHQSLTPACANGIVVCPTETGVVVAVDYAQRRLLWAYQYTSTDAKRLAQAMQRGVAFPNGAFPVDERSDQGWLDGTPIIADGRVFLTPTDSDELYCLNLADGELQWKLPRERAVYLAGADQQRAVLIGPDQIVAVRVTDGSPAWTASVSIPAPTGRGLWMPDRYLVPLSTGEIATIDLERGRLLARSKLPGGETPGNLASNAQYLVSLSARDVAAFRDLRETEAVVARALAADAEDPAALALRGEARLHRGEFETGLADLRVSIAKRPEPYAKSVLASALLEGLRTDFARYRDSVTELETLTDDAQQRNEFVWLVARGLKETGQSLAAFERMTHLIEQSLDEFSAEGAESAWQSRNDRRLLGLFTALYQEASPQDREQLDAQILKWLPKADNTPDGDFAATLRRYLRVFNFHPSAAAARQQLVSKLDPELNSLEYAWELTRLANSTDAAVAAPATATLARWYLQRKRFHDVASLLNSLEGRFADAACAPDATGRQVAEQLRADEDFREAQRIRSAWNGTPVATATNQPTQGTRTTRVIIVGKVPAHYQGWSFETDQTGTMLIARDEVARQRWVLQRPNVTPAAPGFGSDALPAFHRVHLGEHLIGWSVGTSFVVAADLEPQRAGPRVLWQESLLAADGVNSPEQNRMLQQQRIMARRRVLINPGFNFIAPAGTGSLVAVTDQAVIYHNGRKLFAADPLTGQLLWSRRDLSRSLLEIHADDRTVALLSQDWQANNAAPMLHLVRTVDGESLPAAELPAGNVEWIGGSRMLVSEDTSLPAAGPVPLALRHAAGGEPVWSAELARPAVVRVWNQSEVFTLEENRRLTVRNLEDGAVRWSQELSLDLKPDALFVQPWKDRYLVIAGITARQPGTPTVLGLNDNHNESLSGYVVALKQDTGELVWQTPINEPATDPTAFDLSQPAGWPVLLFAGRMFLATPAGAVVPGFAANQAQRLTATLIDKETGRRIYAREEVSNVQMYFVDVDPDLNTLTANFLTWSVELRYKRRK